MKNDYFHGKMVGWYKNGQENRNRTKNGELIGVFTEWYENGKKKHEGRWSYGKIKKKRRT